MKSLIAKMSRSPAGATTLLPCQWAGCFVSFGRNNQQPWSSGSEPLPSENCPYHIYAAFKKGTDAQSRLQFYLILGVKVDRKSKVNERSHFLSC
jgi:hypothetical protein